ncbi:uncharacterized protein [Drosophila bipectinata]|uniref:uncharacterized protein isoform X2 n=1 Tax=Drosophila bipectinata TaxID=42026 RepID=UPI001C89EC4D|nr:uncharacterized protein LOC108134050 isoform X2 [Drosophila bipectinata]
MSRYMWNSFPEDEDEDLMAQAYESMEYIDEGPGSTDYDDEEYEDIEDNVENQVVDLSFQNSPISDAVKQSLMEEAERSIVRVSIYQSNQPQQICPPAEYLLDSIDGGLAYNYSLDYETAVAAMQQQHQLGLGAAYDRQQSTDSGWDNPFRPGGDLSREADEIVNMIRGGKPITPTEDRTIGNGSAHADDNCNGGTVIGESVTKTNLSQNQATAQNGTNSHAGKLEAGDKSATSADQSNGGGGANNGVTNLGQVSKQVVPGPTSASHVVIDEKKNKKKGCCVIQ